MITYETYPGQKTSPTIHPAIRPVIGPDLYLSGKFANRRSQKPGSGASITTPILAYPDQPAELCSRTTKQAATAKPSTSHRPANFLPYS